MKKQCFGFRLQRLAPLALAEITPGAAAITGHTIDQLHHAGAAFPLAQPQSHFLHHKAQTRIGRRALGLTQQPRGRALPGPCHGSKNFEQLRAHILRERLFGVLLINLERQRQRVLRILGQIVKDRRPTLFILGRGHQPRGLVIKPKAGRFRRTDRDTIDLNVIFFGDIERRPLHQLAIERNLARLNEPFCLASAGPARARDDFGDPVTFGRVFLRGLCHTSPLTRYPALAKALQTRQAAPWRFYLSWMQP